jgi:hypothetical protein
MLPTGLVCRLPEAVSYPPPAAAEQFECIAGKAIRLAEFADTAADRCFVTHAFPELAQLLLNDILFGDVARYPDNGSLAPDLKTERLNAALEPDGITGASPAPSTSLPLSSIDDVKLTQASAECDVGTFCEAFDSR